MIFTKVLDKYMSDVKLDELNGVLRDQAFFKFMDSGRQGLVLAAEDVVDNQANWIHVHGPFGRKFRSPDDKFTVQYRQLQREAAANMIDKFITSGSTGLKDAIDQTYHMVWNLTVIDN